jgi:protoporphyrinogen oxidase
MSRKNKITILGGGPAGLAVGYYARKNGIPFLIIEGTHGTGGNSITLEWEGFYFDSGAHRFHDQDKEATIEIKKLMGEDLKRIEVPSQIYSDGKFIDFPLSPVDLLKNLGFFLSLKAGGHFLRARFKKKKISHFKDHATLKYGNFIAERFLLNYSEKLWGDSCENLAVDVAGKRIHGLDLKTFITESFRGKKAKTEHLDGAFYYPSNGGIGEISKRLEEYCGSENIFLDANITQIFHEGKRITSVEINHKKKLEVDTIVNTIPLTLFLSKMKPSPPAPIFQLSKHLLYRSLILVAFFLNKKSVTSNASIYFPDKAFPFTRVYEPKNRNLRLSPQGKTSLVVEIPCRIGDKMWGKDDDGLKELCADFLFRIGFMEEKEIMNSVVYRIKYAYPVLGKDFSEKIKGVFHYLNSFSNLFISGRNGLFLYTHIHDQMRQGKKIIDTYSQKSLNKK